MFKGSPAAQRAFLSVETPSVLGPAPADEELPAALLDSADPNTNASDAGDLEAAPLLSMHHQTEVSFHFGSVQCRMIRLLN